MCQLPNDMLVLAGQSVCMDHGTRCGVGCLSFSQGKRGRERDGVEQLRGHWRKTCGDTEQHTSVLDLLLVTQFAFTEIVL